MAGVEPHGPYVSGRPPPRGLRGAVASAPDAPALRFRDEALTYGELNARANQLAHHLIEHRGWAGHAGGGLHGAFAGDGRRALRDPEGGSRVRAHRPRLSRPTGSRSCSTMPSAPILLTQSVARGSASRSTGARIVAVDLSSGPLTAQPTGNPSSRAGPGRPRLRDLHVRLDRAAQGRDDHAPGDRQPALLDAGGLRA